MIALNSNKTHEEALHGTTLRVYRFIISQNQPARVREIQRSLKLSSPSLVLYHLEKLKNERLIKEEAGGYVPDKIVLKQLIRLRSMLIPRFFFCFLIFTFGSVLELTILLPSVITREYLVAVAFTLAASTAFGIETYLNWRGV